jgi:hypothetical protein
MENNINDKIRVNTYTKLDDNEEKLLDEVFWSSYLWLILFFVFSISLKIHFFAFALFIYFFSFKFQKNLLRNIKNICQQDEFINGWDAFRSFPLCN